jgi:hypothetical protein
VRKARKLTEGMRKNKQIEHDVDELFEALGKIPEVPRFTVGVFEGISLDDSILIALRNVKSKSQTATKLIERISDVIDREVNRIPEQHRKILFPSGFNLLSIINGKTEPPRLKRFPEALPSQYALPLSSLVQMCNFAAFNEISSKTKKLDCVISHSGGIAASIVAGSFVKGNEEGFYRNCECAFVQLFWMAVIPLMFVIDEFGEDTIEQSWTLAVGGIPIIEMQKLVEQACAETDTQKQISIGGINSSQRAIIVGHPTTLEKFRSKLPKATTSEFLPMTFPTHSEFYGAKVVPKIIELCKDFPLDTSHINIHVGSTADGTDLRMV